jgi:hypothetical protein
VEADPNMGVVDKPIEPIDDCPARKVHIRPLSVTVQHLPQRLALTVRLRVAL